MPFTLHEIARIVGAKNDVTQFEDVAIQQIEFDSRKIGPGDLFLPLKGSRDGHEFIEIAFAQGAVATFSEKDLGSQPHLLVEDCLSAFQQLAKAYLTKTGVEVIAVTGSNGKTTTKDMVHDLLATTYRTYKTQGNYNNEIGLPYTVLHMPEDTEKLVLEMGQDHLGDIALLSQLARPKIGIVTLVGEAHLEFFGSRSEIAKGKLQIADGMPADGLLLVPNDQLIQPYLPSQQELVTFGSGGRLQVQDLQEYKDYLTFRTNFLSAQLTIPVTGQYNATNAMIAAYVATRLGVAEEAIVSALAQLQLTKNRTEWKKAANGADLLSDVYNANPTAMRLILETFSRIPANPAGRKLLVLADMKELGPSSQDLHAQLASSIDPAVIDQVYLYGQDMAALYQALQSTFPADRCHYFAKSDSQDQFADLISQIQKDLTSHDQVLLKGSNSMGLGKLVEILEEGY